MSEVRQPAAYQIGAVARVTGISTHTIRVWERRYGAIAPARTRGGSRVYADADVDKLLLLKKLIGQGHSIGRIAHLTVDDLRALSAPGVAPAPASATGAARADRSGIEDRAERVRGELLAALQALDLGAAERTLLHAASYFSPRDLVLFVVAPLIEEVGARWERGELRIAHEHAATALLRNLLGAMLRGALPRVGGATVVAATPSGERHELGLLMAAFMAVLLGWNVVYLGTGLPAAEILHVVAHLDAAALLLSLVNARASETGDEIARALRALGERLPAHVQLVVGGRGVTAYADLLDRATFATDLSALETLLTRA